MGRLAAMCAVALCCACQFDTGGPASVDGGASDATTQSSDADLDSGPDAQTSLPDADLSACPSSYTLSFGGHKYRTGTASWYEARAACEADGARLVVIESDAENEFVLSIQPAGNIWLGMSDHQQEQTYLWITGDPAMGGVYENWQDGQPNDSGGEDCGEMNAGGVWNDLICTFAQLYVCECGGAPEAVPATYCQTRTQTDCDVCGDDCDEQGLTCLGDTCG